MRSKSDGLRWVAAGAVKLPLFGGLLAVVMAPSAAHVDGLSVPARGWIEDAVIAE
jgi:hypothetical protein